MNNTPTLPPCYWRMQGAAAFDVGLQLSDNPMLGTQSGKEWAAGWAAREAEVLAEFAGSYGGSD